MSVNPQRQDCALDAIDTSAVSFFGSQTQTLWLLDHSGKETTDRMLLLSRRHHDRGKKGTPSGWRNIAITTACLETLPANGSLLLVLFEALRISFFGDDFLAADRLFEAE